MRAAPATDPSATAVSFSTRIVCLESLAAFHFGSFLSTARTLAMVASRVPNASASRYSRRNRTFHGREVG